MPRNRAESPSGASVEGKRQLGPFVIPLTPPSANTYVRHTKRGGHYLTPEAKAFKEAVGLICRGKMVDAPLRLTIDCHFLNRQCPDAGNLEKLVCDGLQPHVISNDNLIDELIVNRHFGDNPRTEITIEALRAQARIGRYFRVQGEQMKQSDMEIDKARPLPAVVSMRNRSFRTAQELVQEAVMHIPQEAQFPGFERWLMKYTEDVIRRVVHAFGEGAKRGIEQVSNLLCDPNFYQSKREEKARWRKMLKEDRERQEREQAERRLCPTQQQLEEQINFAEKELSYHKEHLAKYEAALTRMRGIVPKNIRFMPRKDDGL